MIKCDDNIQCIFELDICNRHPICKDRSDEDRQKCTKGMYMFICVCLKYINA